MTKQWENKISLFNRYGSKVFLEHKENNIYYLRGDEEALMAIGVTFDGNLNNIRAIDPSGGPFLCIGYILGDKTVTNIEFIKDKGYKVTLKPLHNETH